MAHKKAGGSSRNGRDTEGRRLGIKKFGGEAVVAAAGDRRRAGVVPHLRALVGEVVAGNHTWQRPGSHRIVRLGSRFVSDWTRSVGSSGDRHCAGAHGCLGAWQFLYC